METTISNPATSIISDRFGHQIAISSTDNKITFLSPQSSTIIGSIQVQGGIPNSLSFSSNDFGPLLAVGLSNGKILIFQRTNQANYLENINAIEFSHKASVSSVSFHPTQPIVASASFDGTFSIHSLIDKKWRSTTILASYMGLSSICWSSNVSDPVQILFVGGVDGTIKVWRSTISIDSWELVVAAHIHDGWVRHISSPNTISGGIQKIGTVGDDLYANLIKFDGKELNIIQSSKLHSQATGVSWAMVDKTLVLSHIDGKTTMWKETDENKLINIQ